MSKKFNIFALAAALTLGVSMLSSVSADAKNWGGYGGGGGKIYGTPSGGYQGPKGGYGGGMKPGGWGGYKPGYSHYRPHYRPHWHYGFRRHYWVAPVAAYGTYAVARPVVAAAPGPCTCLTKEYTPEGAVLFKDRCTSEMAMNPPAQAAPQQTSYQTAPVQAPQQAYVPTYPGPAAAQPVQQ